MSKDLENLDIVELGVASEETQGDQQLGIPEAVLCRTSAGISSLD